MCRFNNEFVPYDSKGKDFEHTWSRQGVFSCLLWWSSERWSSALQEKNGVYKQRKGCDRNSIERSRHVATCQKVEVHEVLLTEDASTFPSSINRGRLNNQVNSHILLVAQDRYKNVKKRENQNFANGRPKFSRKKNLTYQWIWKNYTSACFLPFLYCASASSLVDYFAAHHIIIIITDPHFSLSLYCASTDQPWWLFCCWSSSSLSGTHLDDQLDLRHTEPILCLSHPEASSPAPILWNWIGTFILMFVFWVSVWDALWPRLHIIPNVLKERILGLPQSSQKEPHACEKSFKTPAWVWGSKQ